MKNIFKYIVAFAALSVATLASGLSVSAQNISEGTYLEDNGIAYAKTAIHNNDGTYTIDLETFVTGEVTQTFESVPVDVVLVLDVSGSMRDAISTISSYEPANVNSLTYNNNNGQTDYYYYYNGDYRRVSVVRNWETISWTEWGYRYTLSFQANGRTYYINNSGQVVTDRPTNVSGANTNLLASNVQLYEIVTTTTTKMDALKDAVEAFINQIAHNDWYEDDTNDKRRTTALGNRISIVKFADDGYYNSNAGAESDNAPLTPGNNFNGQYNATQVLRSFTATSTEANVNDLINAVDGLTPAGATAADYGMNLARLLIDSAVSDPNRANSNKTVVFFTDGEPNHQSGFDQNVASAAIRNSKKIKDVTYGEGDDAKHPAVFSVGVFDSKPATGGNLENFMNYVSSNYPAATAYNNGGDKASSSFYMDASGGTAEDLKAIFTAIAHAAGGSGNTDVSGTSSVTVDVVSSSFSVPTGFESASDVVEVLVAPCTGKTTIGGKEYLTFGPEKTPAEYGLDDISPSITEAENKVSTTGFDYSANWCGPDPTNTDPTSIQPGYHGFKQIIRFVITVNDDAVGGPNVETNDSESGIYLDGSDEPLIKFNRPTVKLPVQIWLQKQGLRPGDSAVFTLYMCEFTKWNPDKPIDDQAWENFTKVVVNYDDMDDNGIVKIVGLSPDYFYRLKEDAWAFGYTYQDGGIQYTVGDNVQNPFIFVNTPKPVKYDEASLRNVFKEKKAAADSGSESSE